MCNALDGVHLVNRRAFGRLGLAGMHRCPLRVCRWHYLGPPSAATCPVPRRLVHQLGEGNWSPIARALNEAFNKDTDNGRIGKQCREVRAGGL